MSFLTVEGVIDHGQIRLKTNMRLPDNTRVLVVVPDIQIEGIAHVYSPRLAHPEQLVDFEMELWTMDEYFRQRIEINPDIMTGKPVIRGTRIPVDLLVRLRAQGISEAEILHEYPRLQPEDISAALMYAEAEDRP